MTAWSGFHRLLLEVCITAWPVRYEDDVVLGQRLYRELPPAELPRPEPKSRSRGPTRGRAVPPPESGQWETVATNFDEFKDVVVLLATTL